MIIDGFERNSMLAIKCNHARKRQAVICTVDFCNITFVARHLCLQVLEATAATAAGAEVWRAKSGGIVLECIDTFVFCGFRVTSRVRGQTLSFEQDCSIRRENGQLEGRASQKSLQLSC